MSGARAHLLIVEGVPGAGKSTLLDQLLRRHVALAEERRLRTVVHLTQAHTYGPLAPSEDAGTLTVADNRAHLDRIVTQLEWLASAVDGEASSKCFALVDTLHLTHCLRPGVVAWRDVADFDARLAAVGARLLLLDADDATIRRRTVDERAGSSFGIYVARRFGADATAHFIGEGDRFRELFARSSLRKLRLPAEASPDELTARAFDFWRDGGEYKRAQ